MIAVLEQLMNWDTIATLFVNSQHTSFFNEFMWIFSSKYTWIPMLVGLTYLLFTQEKKVVIISVLAMVLLGFATDWVTSSLFKPYFHRLRPSHDPLLENLIQIVHNYKGGLFGFCSSHAANSFGFALFLSALFRNKLFTYSIMIWAFVNSYSRVYLGVHFVGDVLCGAIYGLLVGYLFYKLYEFAYLTVFSKRLVRNSTLNFSSTGYGKNAIYICCVLLYLSVFMIVLFSLFSMQ